MTNGIWHNDKFWEDYEPGGISNEEIESKIAEFTEIINQSKAIINEVSYNIDQCVADVIDDQLVFITVLNNDMSIVVYIEDEELLIPGKEIKVKSEIIQGNLLAKNVKANLLVSGELNLTTEENDIFKINGELSNNNQIYNVSMIISEDLIGAGTTKLELKGNEAFLSGELGINSYCQIKNLIENHPEVKTLIFTKVPGSVYDDVNMHIGRLIRKGGLITKALFSSKIYSGGVDLFCSGKERIVHKGAELGVHSWDDGDKTAIDYPMDHPAHSLQIEYFEQMLGEKNGKSFYYFTIVSAKADDIYIMSHEEIRKWKIST
ncbi:MAG: hypothetical protein PF574_07815 [Candidatus Delongbacteria bacterium]|jgi:hypothetical protein|nr:hypothetical protein [Candidatus Delongbacteria bacterium]